MKKKNPLVSIVLPVQNSARFLLSSLKSISAQHFKSFEIIAIDDSSCDNSYQILLKFRKSEKRLKVYKNVKRYGLQITLNRAVKKAKGKYIAFMNPSDIISKYRIQKQVEFLLKNSKTAAVGSQCRFINKREKFFGKTLFPQNHNEICQTLLPGLSMNFYSTLINIKLLPKDIFKFETSSMPFAFSNIFKKIADFGEITNLKQYLYFERKEDKDPRFVEKAKNMLNLLILWIKSITVYDYRPSFRSFFLSFSYFL